MINQVYESDEGQCRTERHFAITAAFTLSNASHHALAIDVGDFKTAQCGPSHGGRVQGHEQSTVKEIAGGVDQPAPFPGAEYDRQSPGRLRKKNVLGQKMGA